MAAGRKQNFLFDTFFSPNFFLILSIFRSDFGTHTANGYPIHQNPTSQKCVYTKLEMFAFKLTFRIQK